MLLPNILSCIEISVQGVPTLTTFEEALRATVRAMLITTRTTRLTGVAGGFLFAAYPPPFPLFGNEVVEFGKPPPFQTPFFFSILLSPSPFPFLAVPPFALTF